MSEDRINNIFMNLQDDDQDSPESIQSDQPADQDEPIKLDEYKDDLRKSLCLDRYYQDLGYARKKRIHPDILFTTSAVGLMEVGNVVYTKLCEIGPQFATSVSSSMFMYYVSQLHYMRLCAIEWQESMPDAEDVRAMNEKIQRNKWTVPQLLADYFGCIGPFKDCGGVTARHREIVLPLAEEIEGINGFFGRISSSTHVHYENRISPGVAARRIIEDMIFSLAPRENGYWNLPRDLIPEEEKACGPTGNLLGWKYATSLTTQQKKVLKDCGISIRRGNIVFSHCTRFCHNGRLMSYISSRLDELKGKMQCAARLNTEPTGSIAQHDLQLVGRHGGIPRDYVYGDQNTYNCGFAPLHMHQELFAHAFRLRTVKRCMVMQAGSEETLSTWSCYDFNSYREVPESWVKTRNEYFMYGKLKTWDMDRFKTQTGELNVILDGLIAKTLIQQ